MGEIIISCMFYKFKVRTPVAEHGALTLLSAIVTTYLTIMYITVLYQVTVKQTLNYE